ncbi:MAG: hypothetical protein M1118_14635 [Chloroflexi bacterium]|nr:hypothetical protein [Chloroflexota bacterium]
MPHSTPCCPFALPLLAAVTECVAVVAAAVDDTAVVVLAADVIAVGRADVEAAMVAVVAGARVLVATLFAATPLLPQAASNDAPAAALVAAMT